MPRKPKKKKERSPNYWTYTRVKREAKKYEWYSDFVKYCQTAYRVAKKKGWIESFDWLKKGRRNGWNEERVMEEARKYISSMELYKSNKGAWRYAYTHRLLEKMYWFITCTPELNKWIGAMFGKIYNLLISMGIDATKEWLFIESGKEDEYTEDQRKLLKSWSEKVNEKWCAWKKYKWFYYDDMRFSKKGEPKVI